MAGPRLSVGIGRYVYLEQEQPEPTSNFYAKDPSFQAKILHIFRAMATFRFGTSQQFNVKVRCSCYGHAHEIKKT